MRHIFVLLGLLDDALCALGWHVTFRGGERCTHCGK
jgi:hypothetical protein